VAICMESRTDTPLAADLYPATLAAVVEADSEFGPQLEWTWTLATPDGDERTLRSWCKRVAFLSPKSKAAGIIGALLGRPITYNPPERVDIEALVGRPVRLMVTVENRADGSAFNKITQVLAPVAGGQAPAPAATPAADPTPEELFDAEDPFGGE
jgi:hypothetical protein